MRTFITAAVRGSCGVMLAASFAGLVLGSPAAAAAKRSNFSISNTKTGQFIHWSGRKYRILDPKGARDQDTVQLLAGLMGTIAVSFGLSDSMYGQRIAVECILTYKPNPFGQNHARICELPDRVATDLVQSVEFSPTEWTAFKSALNAKYPGSVSSLGGTYRSAILVGTIGIRGMSITEPRHAYMDVEGWLIVGNQTNYVSVLADGLRIMQLGADIAGGAKALQ